LLLNLFFYIQASNQSIHILGQHSAHTRLCAGIATVWKSNVNNLITFFVSTESVQLWVNNRCLCPSQLTSFNQGFAFCTQLCWNQKLCTISARHGHSRQREIKCVHGGTFLVSSEGTECGGRLHSTTAGNSSNPIQYDRAPL